LETTIKILGIHSSFTGTSHDSSVSLAIDGEIRACVEEERISRRKTSMGYPPRSALMQALEISKIGFREIDLIVSDGITYPNMQEKLFEYLSANFGLTSKSKIQLVHQSDCHLFGGFFQSGFDEALVFDIEGLGDGISISVAKFTTKQVGKKKIIDVSKLFETGRKYSLGNFYTAITQYLGFESVEGEYKVMGMAAYGKPIFDFTNILNFNKNTGNFSGNYFSLFSNLKKTSLSEPVYNQQTLLDLFKTEPRLPNKPLDQVHFDIAASTQLHFSTIYFDLINFWIKKTGIKNIVLSGGCALNALANMSLLKLQLSGLFVMPASSDRGVSLGAAVIGSFDQDMPVEPLADMYLGKKWSNDEIKNELKDNLLSFKVIENVDKEVAKDINQELIVGHFRGRAEFGPRALGARSILACPRTLGMKDKLNSRIKFREDYRPFAPAISATENVHEKFNSVNLEYMTVTIPVKECDVKNFPEACHFDNTSRVQIVNNSNRIIGGVLKELKNLSGHGSSINTSFNLKGEPIVDSPKDALRTFFSSGMDVLYLENFKISKF
jgi:carbamoyltransferase